MRPMTAREALEIERNWPGCDDAKHARRILDALVELREAFKTPQLAPMIAAETKLSALERGGEPETKE